MVELEKTPQQLGAEAAAQLGELELASIAETVADQITKNLRVTGHNSGFRHRRTPSDHKKLEAKCAQVAANMQKAGYSLEDIAAAIARINGTT